MHPADIATERHSKTRDITRSWMPLTAVVGLVVNAALIVWLLAAEHAAIGRAQDTAASAENKAIEAAKATTALAERLTADINAAKAQAADALRATAERLAAEVAALSRGQAVTEANLAAIRAQLDRIEVELRRPR